MEGKRDSGSNQSFLNWSSLTPPPNPSSPTQKVTLHLQFRFLKTAEDVIHRKSLAQHDSTGGQTPSLLLLFRNYAEHFCVKGLPIIFITQHQPNILKHLASVLQGTQRGQVIHLRPHTQQLS